MLIGRPWITGWKAIARYIGLSVRTAKTYHYQYGMPLRRTPGGSVVALGHELDYWLVKFNEFFEKDGPRLARQSNLREKSGQDYRVNRLARNS